MKRLVIVLMVFITSSNFAQKNIFNLSSYKAFSISIKGLKGIEQADYISRLAEKNMFSEFSYVDLFSSTGYFIVKNESLAHELVSAIKRIDNLKISDGHEITLDNELFLWMYQKRTGIAESKFSKELPKKIIMGPFDELTESLYNKAKIIWSDKYPEEFKKLNSINND